MITSIDGSVTIDGTSGQLGNSTDRNLLSIIRGIADVILVGAGTVRAEKYQPIQTPNAEVCELRAARGQEIRPRLAVLSGTANLDPSMPIFTNSGSGDPPLIYTTDIAPNNRVKTLTDIAEVICSYKPSISITEVLEDLYKRGARTVVCEGGPKVNGQLLSANVIDELCLSLSPVLVGNGIGIFDGFPPNSPKGLKLAQVFTDDELLFCRYIAL